MGDTLHLVVLRKGSLPSFQLVTIVLRWRGMGGPGEWAVDVKDVTPLVGEAGKARCSRSKFFLWLVILGGDFNASPTSEGDRTYHTVKEVMTDAFQEIKAALSAWLDPRFATFGNSRNTYTGGKSDPVIYDYIFHKKNTDQAAMIWTNWFYLPSLNTIRGSDQS